MSKENEADLVLRTITPELQAIINTVQSGTPVAVTLHVVLKEAWACRDSYEVVATIAQIKK